MPSETFCNLSFGMLDRGMPCTFDNADCNTEDVSNLHSGCFSSILQIHSRIFLGYKSHKYVACRGDIDKFPDQPLLDTMPSGSSVSARLVFLYSSPSTCSVLLDMMGTTGKLDWCIEDMCMSCRFYFLSFLF